MSEFKYRLFRRLLPKFCSLFGAYAAPVTEYPLQDHTDVTFPITDRHRHNHQAFKVWDRRDRRPGGPGPKYQR